MKVTVLFFSHLEELTGKQQLQLEDFETLDKLLRYLQNRFPALQQQTFSIAVNQTIVNEKNKILNDGDEIALLPPFSGG